MRKEKQIEEMASDIEQSGMLDSLSRCRIVAEELYCKGYRKQKEVEWISVDDRLPDKDGVFIVALEESGYENLVYFDVRQYVDGKWLNIPNKFTVTHWMPLPDPPTMKGGAE